MNRVVLCGRLAERPRISATASGLPLATLRLQVPRQGLSELAPMIDEIECVAFSELAQQLHRWGEPGLRINLEGWLLAGWCRDQTGEAFLLARVAIEAAYWIDPREFATAAMGEEAPPDGSPQRLEPVPDTAPPAEPPRTFFARARRRFARLMTRSAGTDRSLPTHGKGDLACNWP
jgi:single-stranded DNA-binding protein